MISAHTMGYTVSHERKTDPSPTLALAGIRRQGPTFPERGNPTTDTNCRISPTTWTHPSLPLSQHLPRLGGVHITVPSRVRTGVRNVFRQPVHHGHSTRHLTCRIHASRFRACFEHKLVTSPGVFLQQDSELHTSLSNCE